MPFRPEGERDGINQAPSALRAEKKGNGLPSRGSKPLATNTRPPGEEAATASAAITPGLTTRDSNDIQLATLRPMNW